MIIGITGGIGSGKSTVTKIFATLGVPVYDADASTRILMNSNQDLITQIKKHFGNEAYIGQELNRKYIAQLVFNNKEKLDFLNNIVHPYSIADASNWAAKQNAPYVIKESALLFETEAFHYVDKSIGVTAPLPLRIHRIMLRDGISKEDVLARINKQMDDAIKMKLCDYVINNNEQELIIPQVLHLHQLFSGK
jgi:dephospho-CoA kinase